MPIPNSSNAGKIIRFLKNEKPDMPHKQAIAIALETVRRKKKKSRLVSSLTKGE